MRSAAASPTASYGRPSPCSHGSSQSLAIWASVHQLESFGTLQGPTMSHFYEYATISAIGKRCLQKKHRGGMQNVQEDNMAFGRPVKYWKLDPNKVYSTSPNAWDTAVHDASEEYKHRMHNLCCDNCHSHVALALNLMRYDNSSSWNMVKLCFFSLLYGKYVSIGGFVKTWLPFVLFLGAILTVALTLHLR
ncbi:PREDICTED: transmembrane protein 222 isoform X3 [Crocodylus porosus]|uniref:transmembrane protein 222 isoform X3 n=1 Tax=Crocodylus porosus TaxID=8502 RepID=UPI000938E106|nr:PREDICTED: transmembrane protein 222 isoform X3 [Crocodylus porosus]